MRVNALDLIAGLLIIVGAITWGTIGLLEINIIEAGLEPVFQPAAAEVVARSLYAIVGFCGLYFLWAIYRMAVDYRRGDRAAAEQRTSS